MREHVEVGVDPLMLMSKPHPVERGADVSDMLDAAGARGEADIWKFKVDAATFSNWSPLVAAGLAGYGTEQSGRVVKLTSNVQVDPGHRHPRLVIRLIPSSPIFGRRVGGRPARQGVIVDKRGCIGNGECQRHGEWGLLRWRSWSCVQ